MTVGSVRSVEIEGTAVTVEFTVEESDLGRKSAAAIKSDNALGRKYLQVVPAGEGRLEKIPLERTTSPYGVTEALGDLSADKIGRASCRARVCKYVKIWVGAVTVKKKKETRKKESRK